MTPSYLPSKVSERECVLSVSGSICTCVSSLSSVLWEGADENRDRLDRKVFQDNTPRSRKNEESRKSRDTDRDT